MSLQHIRTREKEEERSMFEDFLGSQLSARLGSNYQLKLLSSVWCLCLSVSQRIFSTVCNHGNHKAVALTIIGSDGILKDTTHNHARRKSSSPDQSKGKVIQLASSKLCWDFTTLICCCKKKLFLWQVS